MDEYNCLMCLQEASSRNPKCLDKILVHKSGLTSLATCIVSNLVKSRLIALELLSKMCTMLPEGHDKVLEAITILRILFGESVRFKLLIALLNCSQSSFPPPPSLSNKPMPMMDTVGQFERAVLEFVNSLLSRSSSAQRVRLQCELEEAGLDLQLLEERMRNTEGVDEQHDFWYELKRYRSQYVNVELLLEQNQRSEVAQKHLRDELQRLRQGLSKLESERSTLQKQKQQLICKCEKLEEEMRLVTTMNSIDSNGSSSPRSGSDCSHTAIHSATDSGRWSSDPDDQQACENSQSKKLVSTPSKASNQSQNCLLPETEKVRNEDVLIYSPVIRSLSNHQVQSDELHYAQPNKRRPTNGNKNKHFQLTTNSAGHLTIGSYSNQSTLNLNRKLDQSLTKELKPQVVQVYPKKANTLKNGLHSVDNKYSKNKHKSECQQLFLHNNETRQSSSTTSDQDLDYEQIVHHSLIGVSKHELASTSSAHKKDNENLRGKESRHQFNHCDRIQNEHLATSPVNSESGGFHSLCSPDSNQSSTCNRLEEMSELVSGEFLLRSRRPSVSNTSQLMDRVETLDRLHSLPPFPPSIYGQHVNVNSNSAITSNQSYLNERKPKTGKTLAAQLQSYFFAGSLSSKRKLKLKTKDQLSNHQVSSRTGSDNLHHSDDKESTSVQMLNRLQLSEGDDDDQNSQDLDSEKFPLPNVYKKNFIIKGHSNCGLYSKKKSATETGNVKTLEKPPRGKDKSRGTNAATDGRISKSEIELVPNSCVNIGSATASIGTNMSHFDPQGFKSLQRFQLPDGRDQMTENGCNAKLVHREITLAAKELGAWY